MNQKSYSVLFCALLASSLIHEALTLAVLPPGNYQGPGGFGGIGYDGYGGVSRRYGQTIQTAPVAAAPLAAAPYAAAPVAAAPYAAAPIDSSSDVVAAVDSSNDYAASVESSSYYASSVDSSSDYESAVAVDAAPDYVAPVAAAPYAVAPVAAAPYAVAPIDSSPDVVAAVDSSNDYAASVESSSYYASSVDSSSDYASAVAVDAAPDYVAPVAAAPYAVAPVAAAPYAVAPIGSSPDVVAAVDSSNDYAASVESSSYYASSVDSSSDYTAAVDVDSAPDYVAPVAAAPYAVAPVAVAPIDSSPDVVAAVDSSNDYSASVESSSYNAASVDSSSDYAAAVAVDAAPDYLVPIDASPDFVAPIDLAPLDASPDFVAPVDVAPDFVAAVDSSNDYSASVESGSYYAASVDTSSDYAAVVDTAPDYVAAVDASPDYVAPIQLAPIDVAPDYVAAVDSSNDYSASVESASYYAASVESSSDYAAVDIAPDYVAPIGIAPDYVAPVDASAAAASVVTETSVVKETVSVKQTSSVVVSSESVAQISGFGYGSGQVQLFVNPAGLFGFYNTEYDVAAIYEASSSSVAYLSGGKGYGSWYDLGANKGLYFSHDSYPDAWFSSNSPFETYFSGLKSLSSYSSIDRGISYEHYYADDYINEDISGIFSGLWPYYEDYGAYGYERGFNYFGSVGNHIITTLQSNSLAGFGGLIRKPITLQYGLPGFLNIIEGFNLLTSRVKGGCGAFSANGFQFNLNNIVGASNGIEGLTQYLYQVSPHYDLGIYSSLFNSPEYLFNLLVKLGGNVNYGITGALKIVLGLITYDGSDTSLYELISVIYNFAAFTENGLNDDLDLLYVELENVLFFLDHHESYSANFYGLSSSVYGFRSGNFVYKNIDIGNVVNILISGVARGPSFSFSWISSLFFEVRNVIEPGVAFPALGVSLLSHFNDPLGLNLINSYGLGDLGVSPIAGNILPSFLGVNDVYPLLSSQSVYDFFGGLPSIGPVFSAFSNGFNYANKYYGLSYDLKNLYDSTDYLPGIVQGIFRNVGYVIFPVEKDVLIRSREIVRSVTSLEVSYGLTYSDHAYSYGNF
ncbi:uncharacterized protein LOC115875494 [Sitophilus oryzae]|uniref:Uncharacterized protein LOC115875494 n=1 Tax=Sitophilus oryzae TaxID=7048 RepID=A0A6J2X6M9_SITOR|nr:uncharacterized protein LOC115875494 [Sitophilus oryzae]